MKKVEAQIGQRSVGLSISGSDSIKMNCDDRWLTGTSCHLSLGAEETSAIWLEHTELTYIAKHGFVSREKKEFSLILEMGSGEMSSLLILGVQHWD